MQLCIRQSTSGPTHKRKGPTKLPAIDQDTQALNEMANLRAYGDSAKRISCGTKPRQKKLTVCSTSCPSAKHIDQPSKLANRLGQWRHRARGDRHFHRDRHKAMRRQVDRYRPTECVATFDVWLNMLPKIDLAHNQQLSMSALVTWPAHSANDRHTVERSEL